MAGGGGLILRGSTWHMRFTVRGVMVAESTHTSSRRDAERILAKRKAELVDQLVLGKLKPIKLHDAIDEFQRSRSHLPSHKNVVMHLNLFRDGIPNHFLHRVTDHELLSVTEDRLAAGYAQSTVGVTINYFNALLKYCEEKGYTVRKKMTTIKGVKGKIRWLTREELAKFIDALDPSTATSEVQRAQRQDNQDLVKLLAHTGTRYSEIANMTWGQVDIAGGKVVIKRAKNGRDSTLHFTKVMREVFERRRKTVEGDYVFPTKVGRHNETHWVKRAVERAGLSTVDGSVTLHTLRHSAAVHWLQSGLNLLEVQEMLGHTNHTSTMIYLHLVPGNAAKRAQEILDAS